MAKRTTNLNLPIIEKSDYTTTKVTDMIEGIQGDNNSSAFNIIDTAVAGKQNALEFNAPIPSGTSYIELTTLKDGNIYYRLMGGGGGGGT